MTTLKLTTLALVALVLPAVLPMWAAAVTGSVLGMVVAVPLACR